MLTSVDDGSSHVVEAYGEALDASDKATAKAMSAAYKSAMIQTFCIPIAGSEDPDRTSPRASRRDAPRRAGPGLGAMGARHRGHRRVCESEQAIALVQERNRDLLKALSRERSTLSPARRMLLRSPRSARQPAAPADAGRSASEDPDAHPGPKSGLAGTGRKTMPELRFPSLLPREPRKKSSADLRCAPRLGQAPSLLASPAAAASDRMRSRPPRHRWRGSASNPPTNGPSACAMIITSSSTRSGSSRSKTRYDLDLVEIAREFVRRSPFRQNDSSVNYAEVGASECRPTKGT